MNIVLYLKEAEQRLLENEASVELLTDVWMSSYALLTLTSMLCLENGVSRPDSWVADLLTDPDYVPHKEWPYSKEEIVKAILPNEKQIELNTRWRHFCEVNQIR